MTDQIKQLILKHSDAGEISRVAAEAGMHTMLDDGLRKAVAGKTTIEEVRRVTQEQSHTQQLGEDPSGSGTAVAGEMPTEPAEAAEHEAEKTDSLLAGHLKTLSRFKRHE